MGQPAAGERQYFLGIEGEQSGPFSETDILGRIKKSMVPPDALIWFEGMSDWQPINTVEPFKTTLELVKNQFTPPPAEATPAYKPGAYKPKTSAKDDVNMDDPFVFPAGGQAGEPLFKGAKPSPLKGLVKPIMVGAAVLAAGAGLLFFFQGQLASLFGGEAADPVARKKVTPVDQREVSLHEAQSQLLLNPDTSLHTLAELARSPIADKVAKEALGTAVDYYRKMQRPLDAAHLLMDAKQPAQAVKFFMMEPPSYREAEEAYFQAYQQSNSASEKRQFLLEDIKLLLAHLDNIELATSRVRELEKAFPNQPNPYQFYTKPVDERIADIFSRISFYFVQNLLAYLNAELPQVQLTSRPLIEIKKDKQAMYRLVGNYKGDVRLNQDTLTNIYFVFWLVGEQWVIVDTNLTAERQKFAHQERDKHKTDELGANEMLNYLQLVFKAHFPGTLLHERVDIAKAKTKNIVE